MEKKSNAVPVSETRELKETGRSAGYAFFLKERMEQVRQALGLAEEWERAFSTAE